MLVKQKASVHGVLNLMLTSTPNGMGKDSVVAHLLRLDLHTRSYAHPNPPEPCPNQPAAPART